MSAKSAEFSIYFDVLFPGDKTIEIPGIKYKILEQIVRFLYCGGIDPDFKLDVPEAGRLLAASVRFKISGLQNYCVDFLRTHMNVGDARYVAQLGNDFGFVELNLAAKKFHELISEFNQNV